MGPFSPCVTWAIEITRTITVNSGTRLAPESGTLARTRTLTDTIGYANHYTTRALHIYIIIIIITLYMYIIMLVLSERPLLLSLQS